MTLRATPSAPETAKPVLLTLEVIAEKDVVVTVESYDEALRKSDHRFDFRVIDSFEEAAKPIADGKLKWLYQYQIEFVLADEYELPSASVSFVTGNTDDVESGTSPASSEPVQIETDALPIVVTSPEEAGLSDEQLKEIHTLDPVELPSPWRKWIWQGPLLLLAGLAALGILIYLLSFAMPPLRRLFPWLRKKLSPSHDAPLPPPTPAHEWAKRELAILISEDLLTKGQVQQFYFRISDIVRGYIERRYDVSAPEMTTEEFLQEAASDGRFGEAITTELSRFLSECDMVKFARFMPKQEEGSEMVRTTEGLVEKTRRREFPEDASVSAPHSESEEMRS